MRYLITGIAGMTGRHLATHIHQASAQQDEIFGIGRTALSANDALFQDIPFSHYSAINLMNEEETKHYIHDVKPTYIFHLAAYTHVGQSFSQASRIFINNTVPQIHLFESVRQLHTPCRIHIASSSEVYAYKEAYTDPLREEDAQGPISPYGTSKWSQEQIALQYHRTHRIPILITRTFNYTGPFRSDDFVESRFAKWFAQVSLGQKESVLYTGNIDTKRDFTDVRDVVRALYSLSKLDQSGQIYQISSGVPRKISSIIDVLSRYTGIIPTIKTDHSLVRVQDRPVLYGSYDKLNRDTGWQPYITFEKTIQDLYSYWLEKTKEQGVVYQ